ncbi:signal peptidase I [Williamsia sp.]|uniref:signal peptidase I n=1 Tax=Williamsia sp. TaxID=1872085 RepID=UPI002F95B01C
MTSIDHDLSEQTNVSRRSRGSRIGDWLLNTLAVCGVVCIVVVLCAVFFNISLIMFKTGSMSPAIPAGSLAVVRELPANSVAVGDVVTIDRKDQLPVTHRVVETSPGDAGTTLLELRGDANNFDDPGGYQVTTVRKVLWSAPGLAHGVVWLSNPYVLGSITISAALLVLWAFWPRKREEAAQTTADMNPES